MNITYIIAGLVFLFNPYVNLIDILPDFIGCALIMRGIAKARFLNLSFEGAYNGFKKLMYLEMCKIPALLVYGGVNISSSLMFGPDTGTVVAPGASYKDYTVVLIMTALFAVLEMIIALPAWKDLFDGIRTESYEREDISLPDETVIKSFSVAYAVIRPALALLPELTALSSGNYGYVTDSGILALSKYRRPITLVCVLICLVIGIVWLVKSIKYFKKLSLEKLFLDDIDERYRLGGFEESRDLRATYSALGLMLAGLVFLLEIRVDGVNIIPTFAAGGFFLAGYIILRKINSHSETGIGIAISSVFTALSAAFTIYSAWMNKQYYNDNDSFSYAESLEAQLSRSFEALDRFTVHIIISALCSLALIALLVFFYRLEKEMAERYIKIPALGGDILTSDVTDAKAEKKKAKMLRILTLVLGVLSAASSAVMTYFTVYMAWWWTFDIIIRGVFVVVSMLGVGLIMQNVMKADKYHMIRRLKSEDDSEKTNSEEYQEGGN